MSQYHHCNRCGRGSSHSDSYRLDMGDMQIAAYPDRDWCAHCGPQWQDTIKAVEILGTHQYQDGPNTLDNDALLHELYAQQDAAAVWYTKGMRVYFGRKRWG